MFNTSPITVQRRSLFTGTGLLAAVLATGVGFTVHAAPVPKKDEPARAAPKKDEPEAKPQEQGPIFPNFDDLFPNLPPGAFPAQPEEFRQQFEEMRKIRQKALEDLARAMQQQRGGLARIPGIRGAPGVGRAESNMHESRLGALVELPSATLVDQLDLPKEQGVVVNDVLPDSAAAKAGLKAHDILLEVDGKAVPSKIDDFVKQLNDIKPNTPVDAVVLRKGRKETVKGLSLPGRLHVGDPDERHCVGPPSGRRPDADAGGECRGR